MATGPQKPTDVSDESPTGLYVERPKISPGDAAEIRAAVLTRLRGEMKVGEDVEIEDFTDLPPEMLGTLQEGVALRLSKFSNGTSAGEFIVKITSPKNAEFLAWQQQNLFPDATTIPTKGKPFAYALSDEDPQGKFWGTSPVTNFIRRGDEFWIRTQRSDDPNAISFYRVDIEDEKGPLFKPDEPAKMNQNVSTSAGPMAGLHDTRAIREEVDNLDRFLESLKDGNRISIVEVKEGLPSSNVLEGAICSQYEVDVHMEDNPKKGLCTRLPKIGKRWVINDRSQKGFLVRVARALGELDTPVFFGPVESVSYEDPTHIKVMVSGAIYQVEKLEKE